MSVARGSRHGILPLFLSLALVGVSFASMQACAFLSAASRGGPLSGSPAALRFYAHHAALVNATLLLSGVCLAVGSLLILLIVFVYDRREPTAWKHLKVWGLLWLAATFGLAALLAPVAVWGLFHSGVSVASLLHPSAAVLVEIAALAFSAVFVAFIFVTPFYGLVQLGVWHSREGRARQIRLLEKETEK